MCMHPAPAAAAGCCTPRGGDYLNLLLPPAEERMRFSAIMAVAFAVAEAAGPSSSQDLSCRLPLAPPVVKCPAIT